MQDLEWACYHDTSTPHKPQNNTLIERCGRMVKEGTVLHQSGLNVEWWAEAQQCFCFLHNVSDILYFGTTPYKRRYGADYTGPTIPFGTYVMYKPKNPQVLNEMHPRGSQLLKGILIGYDQRSGGQWSGDLLIADWEQLSLVSESSQVRLKRIDAREVFPETRDGKYRFPCAEGVLAQPNGFERTGSRQRNRQTVTIEWRGSHDPDHPSKSAYELDGPDDGAVVGHGTNEQGDVPSSPPLWSQPPNAAIDDLAGQADAQLPDQELHEPPTAGQPTIQPAQQPEDSRQCLQPEPPGPTVSDYWTVNEYVAIRHHVIERKSLYTPTQEAVSYTHLTLPTTPYV